MESQSNGTDRALCRQLRNAASACILGETLYVTTFEVMVTSHVKVVVLTAE